MSFSLKHKNYQRSIREAQLVRAEQKLQKPSSLKKKRPNDPARFIQDYSLTAEGELAERTIYELDLEKVEKVEKHVSSRKLTTKELRDGLLSMNFHYMEAGAYIPNYTRTDLTDALHAAMGFRTDFEVLTAQEMKKIFSFTKK